jgi:putative flippase GtrA
MSRTEYLQDILSKWLTYLSSRTRFGQFVSVGVIGASFDIATLVILTEVVGLSAIIANIISIEVAILVMFTVNEFWTFAAYGMTDITSISRRLFRSHIVRVSGSTLQYTLFIFIFYNFSVNLQWFSIDFWLVIVKGGAILLAMFVNYVFESLFTWRVQDK